MVTALNMYFHNRNIHQRLLCLLLSILIILLCIYDQYQEAYAFFPAVVLAGYAVPEVVAIVGTLLCAAGLAWAGQTAIDATCDWFYANCAPEIKQGMPIGGFNYIIAPFNREEEAKWVEMSKEGFTELVLSSVTFRKVVEFVTKHSSQKEALTDEKVVAAYRRLIGDYYDALSNASVRGLYDTTPS